MRTNDRIMGIESEKEIRDDEVTMSNNRFLILS